MSKSTASAEAASSMSGEVLIFLFTDIEGSTLRWELAPEAMRTALARHDALVRSAIAAAGGRVFKSVGDAFCAVFGDPASAFSAALNAQQAIACDGFAEVGGLKVRMAVDAGAVEARDGDYFGRPLNRVARLLAAGHGGQILVAESAADLVRDALPANLTLIALGSHYLKDFAEPQEIYQLAATDTVSAFPGLRTLSTTRGNLPQRVTSFIGREAEIEEIKGLLETSRLVTLVGSGGVGKTSASLKVGTDLGSRFKEGVWFVELAPIADPTLIPEIILSLFNAPSRHWVRADQNAIRPSPPEAGAAHSRQLRTFGCGNCIASRDDHRQLPRNLDPGLKPRAAEDSGRDGLSDAFTDLSSAHGQHHRR